MRFAQQLAGFAGPAILGRPVYPGERHAFSCFLTRLLTPDVIVETGVADGWSSHAFLAGSNDNGAGHLYSSDFPYFRESDPERTIGRLVPAELKGRWTLLTAGDEKNMPQVLDSVTSVYLFHYDSDKRPVGRGLCHEPFHTEALERRCDCHGRPPGQHLLP